MAESCSRGGDEGYKLGEKSCEGISGWGGGVGGVGCLHNFVIFCEYKSIFRKFKYTKNIDLYNICNYA